MADSGTGLERVIDVPAYSPITSGDRVPDRTPRSIAPLADSAQPELASLIKLGTLKLETGDDAEAEKSFRKALDLADRTLGPEHPEVVILLTDLTRFYLKKSAHAAAEPLLLRLLEMKRVKGEDHPEFATVLASLANVRQALGSHESAEQLLRRVLEIRERTLAPNHFAIASALEHLGDACAARGKISEALDVFQRAVSIRERTLGPEHPSLRVVRERIADLELQASEGSLDPLGGLASAISPEKYRLTSGEPLTLPAPASPVREKAPPTPVKKQPVIIPFADRTVWVETPDPPATPAVAASAIAATSTAMETVPSADALPYRDILESVREELENQPNTFGERSAEVFGAVAAFLGKKQVMGGVATVALALVLVAAITSARASGGASQTNSPAATASQPPAARVSSVTPTTAAATDPASAAAIFAAGAVKTEPTRPRVVEEKPSASKKAPDKKTESRAETKGVAIPSLSSSIMSRLDSVASTAANAPTRATDAFAMPAAPTRSTATFSDDQSSAPTRARLIGDLPTPRVPNQVADVEGEVRVKFSVDAQGNPVMSTFEVVHSPNPLLTTAVRKVIPAMRFEPARSGGSDSRAITDVVQVGFQFARSNR